MEELEQLKEEHRKLLAKEDVKRQERIERQEKITLKRKIWKMKHPKTIRVVRVVKQSTEGVGMMAKWAGKKVAPVIKQGAMNIAENMYAEAEKTPQGYPKKKKVVRVKKVKRKSPKKKRVVVIKKVKRRQSLGIPNFDNFFG